MNTIKDYLIAIILTIIVIILVVMQFKSCNKANEQETKQTQIQDSLRDYNKNKLTLEKRISVLETEIRNLRTSDSSLVETLANLDRTNIVKKKELKKMTCTQTDSLFIRYFGKGINY
jgi:uncharacterized protein YlxW (UPF0749 family)